MILIYGLPPQIYNSDGMHRRMAFIDSIFSDKERIYVYPDVLAGIESSYSPGIETIDKSVSFFLFSFSFNSHRSFFTSLLRASDFLYAHTVHSAQYLYPYYKTG
jgi:hypothetical protein